MPAPAATPVSVIGPNQARCLVTGTVANKADMIAYSYEGTTYYFCCTGCVASFKRNPNRYLQPQSPPLPPDAGPF